MQRPSDERAALGERVAVLERAFAAHRDALGTRPRPTEDAVLHERKPAGPPAAILQWPHMTDNIFLGRTALPAAHWMATGVPVENRAVFRLVALAVALPFGYRFETNARASTAGQVLAAPAFGCLGALSIGLLDILLTERRILPTTAGAIVASVATIALSHYAGSILAGLLWVRRQRQACEPAVQPTLAITGSTNPLIRFVPAKIKSTAETVKALYDAAVPIAASAAALWAAIGYLLF
jgi:hypothetical protein